MKRVVLLLIIMMSVRYTFSSVPNKTIEITMTVGVPCTISPYADLGIPYNWVQKSYNPNDDNKVDGGYLIIDGSGTDGDGFSVVTNKAISKELSTSPVDYYYYTYTLTPVKTGFFTFKQCVYYFKDYQSNFGSPVITYNITVVNLIRVVISS